MAIFLRQAPRRFLTTNPQHNGRPSHRQRQQQHHHHHYLPRREVASPHSNTIPAASQNLYYEGVTKSIANHSHKRPFFSTPFQTQQSVIPTTPTPTPLPPPPPPPPTQSVAVSPSPSVTSPLPSPPATSATSAATATVTAAANPSATIMTSSPAATSAATAATAATATATLAGVGMRASGGVGVPPHVAAVAARAAPSTGVAGTTTTVRNVSVPHVRGVTAAAAPVGGGVLSSPMQQHAVVEDMLCPDLPLMFDTHKLVAYLKAGGFSQLQSEAITEALARVSEKSNRHHTSHMVTKSEFESLRSELSILEKADFALLKTDINAIEKRLETSVAEIYTAIERVENRVIKWVIAVAGAIGLAILRLTTTSGSDQSRSGVHRPPSNVGCRRVVGDGCGGCEECQRRGLQIVET